MRPLTIKECRPILQRLIKQYHLKGKAAEEAIDFIEKGICRNNGYVLRNFKHLRGSFDTYIIVIARSLLYAYFLQSGILPERFSEKVKSYIKKMLPEFQDPAVSKCGEDLDSIYNKVLEKMIDFEGRSSFFPYLEKAIRFVRGDYLRKMKTEPNINSVGLFEPDNDEEQKGEQMEDFPDPPGSPPAFFETKEESIQLSLCIQSLDPEVRLALFLRHLFG